MKLMLRNLFHVPLRIVEETLRDGSVRYVCQYQNVFGKWKTRRRFDMFGMPCSAIFILYQDAYEFNHGKVEKGKVIDSCYRKRW